MDENAVSPVIGVILMVAITVILAAVVASFMFNIPENAQENPNGLIECSKILRVEDKYKTPSNNYIKFYNRPYYYSYNIEDYNNINIGDYVDRDLFGPLHTIKVQELSENETGYRDACRIIEENESTSLLSRKGCSNFTSKKCVS